MRKTTYKEMGNKIANSEEFTGSSVSAYLSTDGKMYVVTSYSTAILRIDIKRKGDIKRIIYNDYFYSMTTRKIQGIIKKYLETFGFKAAYVIGKRNGKHYIDTKYTYKKGKWFYVYFDKEYSIDKHPPVHEY